ncbi:unnamed protein product [Camellia sinensis]
MKIKEAAEKKRREEKRRYVRPTHFKDLKKLLRLLAMDLGIERPDIGGAENGAKSALCSSSSSGHVASTTDLFRRAILESGPPENFALKTVQEVIKPQKQTKLVQDENQLLENILRTLLQELVSAAVQSGEKIMEYGQLIVDGEVTQGQIPRLLDIVLYLCEKEHVEAGMIFQLLEDLTEMSTMRNCKDIFGYIESKQDILGKSGIVCTRQTCDVEDMQSTSPSSIKERSAVNIKGVFNTSNETKYEKEAPEVVVLNTFDAQPLSDEEGNANNLEDEAATFGIKYLTSSKLMGLELKDPSFRRHVLVQCLILFDYLKAPGKNDKDLPSETLGAIASGVAIPRPRSLPFGVTLRLQNPNPKNKEVVLIPTYTARQTSKHEFKKEEIKSFEERVKKLLEMTPPNGKEFLNSIDHILERERNWVWWKRDGCPPFEKPLIEKKSVQDGAKKRIRIIPGNALTDPQRVRTPAVTEYWKPLAEDMDLTAGIEAEYHHKNNRVYCWKGLRFSARQDLDGFSRFTEYGIEGVVPLELLPSDVRSKYQAKPTERSKRAKKEETKGAAHQGEENQKVQTVLANDETLHFTLISLGILLLSVSIHKWRSFVITLVSRRILIQLLPGFIRDQTCLGKIATPASEIDGEGSRVDLEASAAPMDTDAAMTSGNMSQGGTPTQDEQHKQSSDTTTDGGQEEPGQIEADAEQAEAEAEAEAGMIDGEIDAEVDLDAVG